MVSHNLCYDEFTRTPTLRGYPPGPGPGPGGCPEATPHHYLHLSQIKTCYIDSYMVDLWRRNKIPQPYAQKFDGLLVNNDKIMNKLFVVWEKLQ